MLMSLPTYHTYSSLFAGLLKFIVVVTCYAGDYLSSYIISNNNLPLILHKHPIDGPGCFLEVLFGDTDNDI